MRKMSYNTSTVNGLYHGSTTSSEPDQGTTVDGTGSETATMTPETSSFNSTKLPDVASNNPGMGTMLLSFGIITVIGLAVAMVRHSFLEVAVGGRGLQNSSPLL